MIYFGKPHPPIYSLALETVARFKPSVAPSRTLAIGDGIATDVLGAEQAGLDCLFISGGLAAREVGPQPEAPDATLLAAYLARHGRRPRYCLGLLR